MIWRRWTLDELVRAWVHRVVRRSPSISEAARRLGWHRRQLQRWLIKNGRPPMSPSQRRH